MEQEDIAVIAAARTPFGKFGGTLRDLTHPQLGAHVVRHVLDRAGADPSSVDEVAFGVNLPGADRSIARQILVDSGIPPEKVAYTVDRACCSSLAAITLASRSLRVGDADVAIAGGAENMSRTPYFLTQQRWGHSLGDITLKDQLVIACPMTGRPRAVQAGEEAVEYGITREQQDVWAARSHHRYIEARDAGKFAEEIVAIDVDAGRQGMVSFAEDEAVRPDTTVEKLAKLKPIYGNPTVTAGNAPGLSTGATAMLLTKVRTAEAHGMTPLATLHGWSMASGHPDRIASIPAEAIRMALKKTGLTLDDMDVIEINEAFAAVPLVSSHILAGHDEAAAEKLRERINVNGGAIAIGHPTGATAARLVMTAMYELRRRYAADPSRPYYGVVGICGGIGEAEGVVVRVGA
ncbi:thiolase family protein [Intrasporangium calvum]|uniref:Probable acetyl-CoA acetyltransferase n=1 Tax=Intrasporangium calvum TaxID=53358 RepID=A0ABT5GF72_9MICO|nr:thiolase family protein [Intrasporangium calvum]MDC5696536.1 thiolase family protein [Intrasporangium calvum]